MLKTQQVRIDDKSFTATQLTIGELRRLEPFILAAGDKTKTGFQMMAAAAQVVHAGLCRAHPDLTSDELESMLTLAELKPVIETILELSGLKVADAGEEKPAGA